MIERKIKKAKKLMKENKWDEAESIYSTAIREYGNVIDSYALFRAKRNIKMLTLVDEPSRIDALPWTLDGIGGWSITEKFVVFGWISPPFDRGDRVSIQVNNVEIAHTRLSEMQYSATGRKFFFFQRFLNQLIGYLGEEDSITVIVGDHVIPFEGSQNSYSQNVLKSSYFCHLLNKINKNNIIFNKYGKLQEKRTQNSLWFRSVYGLYNELRTKIKHEKGLELFAFYGTMLRAVRDGKLSDETNDFDTVVFLTKSDAYSVRKEFILLVNFLISEHYVLEIQSTLVKVVIPGVCKLDIFFAWFDDNGEMGISYGQHGPVFKHEPGCIRPRSEKLWSEDTQVVVPSEAEKMLYSIYGAGWNSPDPGFSHYTASRVRNKGYALTSKEVKHLKERAITE